MNKYVQYKEDENNWCAQELFVEKGKLSHHYFGLRKEVR